MDDKTRIMIGRRNADNDQPQLDDQRRIAPVPVGPSGYRSDITRVKVNHITQESVAGEQTFDGKPWSENMTTDATLIKPVHDAEEGENASIQDDLSALIKSAEGDSGY